SRTANFGTNAYNGGIGDRNACIATCRFEYRRTDPAAAGPRSGLQAAAAWAGPSTSPAPPFATRGRTGLARRTLHGEGRTDRNERPRGRNPAGLAVPRDPGQRPRARGLYRRQDAQEPYPHH